MLKYFTVHMPFFLIGVVIVMVYAVPFTITAG